MMLSKLQKSLIELTNRMMAMNYSQEVIEQTLYVFLVARKELKENMVLRVNELLDEKLEEQEFWHDMSKLCLETMKRHTPEELKKAIEKRQQERESK